MAVKWRQTKEYRVWRVNVIRRDKRCVVCGSIKNRQAHHLEDGSNNPDLRFVLSNGVTLCRGCHTVFHTDYKKSFRYKTTLDDFQNFLRIVEYVKSLQLK